MRSRRNVRKNIKIVEILTNRNFVIISIILLAIIIVSFSNIIIRKEQDKKLLAEQKEKIEKETEAIFSEIEGNTNNIQTASSKRIVDISIVGDILCGEDMLKDAKTSNGYEFDYMFNNIAKYVKSSDISIGTFETNIVNKTVSGYKKYNSPIEFLKAIKNSGIDMVSLAHNHELDYGIEGLNETVKNIESNEIEITGIKSNSKNENKEFTGNIKEINNIKIAFLAYTYGLSNENEISSENKEYANIYSEEKVNKDIEYAKQNSNFIVVIMHWGDVNNSNVNEFQNSVTGFLVNSGVDMILGSHPSVIEPMTMVKNNEGKNVLVAYSLGNYISSLKYENADVELILNIRILKDGDEDKAVIKKVDYTPIYLIDNGDKAENRFELADMKMLAINYADGDTSRISRNIYDKIINKLDWLNKLVIPSK